MLHHWNAQDAILSLFWLEGLDRDRSASRRFARMDIITSTCKEEMSIWNWLTLTTSYINITSIQKHIQTSYGRAGSDYGRKQTIKWHPSLPSQAAVLEPILWSKKKKNSKSNKASRSRHIIALPVPATVVVVICEPQGLSNLISKGIKTIKA